MSDEPKVVTREDTPSPARRKRSWKSRLLELALWAALSIVTAIIMVALSDTLLPNNF